jgi:hypothetical protein
MYARGTLEPLSDDLRNGIKTKRVVWTFWNDESGATAIFNAGEMSPGFLCMKSMI